MAKGKTKDRQPDPDKHPKDDLESDDILNPMTRRAAQRSVVQQALWDARAVTRGRRAGCEEDLKGLFREIPDRVVDQPEFWTLAISDPVRLLADLGIELEADYENEVTGLLRDRSVRLPKSLYQKTRVGRQRGGGILPDYLRVGDDRGLAPALSDQDDDEVTGQRREALGADLGSLHSAKRATVGIQVSEDLLSQGLQHWFSSAGVIAVFSFGRINALHHRRESGGYRCSLIIDLERISEIRVWVNATRGNRLRVQLPVTLHCKYPSGHKFSFPDTLSGEGEMQLKSKGWVLKMLTGTISSRPPGDPYMHSFIGFAIRDYFIADLSKIPLIEIESSDYDLKNSEIVRVIGTRKSGLSIGLDGVCLSNALDNYEIDECILEAADSVLEKLKKSEAVAGVIELLSSGEVCPDNGDVCFTGIPSFSFPDDFLEFSGIVIRISGPAVYKWLFFRFGFTYHIDIRIYCENGVVREEVLRTDAELDPLLYILAGIFGFITGGGLFGSAGAIAGAIAGITGVGVVDAVGDDLIGDEFDNKPLFDTLRIGKLEIENEPICKTLELLNHPLVRWVVTSFRN